MIQSLSAHLGYSDVPDQAATIPLHNSTSGGRRGSPISPTALSPAGPKMSSKKPLADSTGQKKQ